MCKPTNRNWQELKRLGRYLIAHPRAVIHYNWQSPMSVVTAESDSDWAGDRKTRKSTSAGVIRVGHHFIKSWSKDQSIIALSSAEAELYAIIKASSELLGQLSLMEEWYRSSTGKLWADASAALGIIGRSGLGKLRHIDTNFFGCSKSISKKRLILPESLGQTTQQTLVRKHCALKLFSGT